MCKCNVCVCVDGGGISSNQCFDEQEGCDEGHSSKEAIVFQSVRVGIDCSEPSARLL